MQILNTRKQEWTKSEVALKAAEIKAIPRKISDRFAVRLNGEIKIIEYKEISHFRADGSYCHIVLHNHKFSMLSNITLKSIENALQVDYFVRIHQSYLVNALSIRAISGRTVKLENGTELPLARRRKADLLAKFHCMTS